MSPDLLNDKARKSPIYDLHNLQGFNSNPIQDQPRFFLTLLRWWNWRGVLYLTLHWHWSVCKWSIVLIKHKNCGKCSKNHGCEGSFFLFKSYPKWLQNSIWNRVECVTFKCRRFPRDHQSPLCICSTVVPTRLSELPHCNGVHVVPICPEFRELRDVLQTSFKTKHNSFIFSYQSPHLRENRAH